MKLEFLLHEFQTLTIEASFQRGKIYKNTDEKQRESFKNGLREKLHELSNKYKNKEVGEEDHIENIKELIRFSKKYNSILRNGELRTGIAQKLLNLYLKYLWCAGLIGIPPHCPFDRRILDKQGIKENWTECDNIEDYKRWVEKAKEQTKKDGFNNLAEWELKYWQRRG